MTVVVVCGAVGFGVWWFKFKGAKFGPISPGNTSTTLAPITTKTTFPSNTTTSSANFSSIATTKLFDVTEVDDVKLPWLVSLMRNDENNSIFLCGGSIISFSHVLAGNN